MAISEIIRIARIKIGLGSFVACWMIRRTADEDARVRNRIQTLQKRLIECKNKEESTSRSSILEYVFKAINEISPLTKFLEIPVNIYNKNELKFWLKVKVD